MAESASPKHVLWEFGEIEKTAVCEADTGLVVHRPRPGDNQFTHEQLSQIIHDHNSCLKALEAFRSLDRWSRGPAGNVDGLEYDQDIQDAVMGARDAIAKEEGQEVQA
jgi:hypothetical protein